MIAQSPNTLTISQNFESDELSKNSWLVILYATRIPPHIGILIDGNYNSLTIKGHELNVNSDVLRKTISQKKIPTLFIKLKKHPVFSLHYQKEICQLYIQQFTKVKPNESSCLNPIKLFLQEFYAISENKNELLFELIERLKQNNYLEKTVAFNLDNDILNNKISLPTYSINQLQNVIATEIANYYRN